MARGAPVLILDRDGVLNAMVVDAEHGTIDSPLHPDQVRLLPGVAQALVRAQQLGFTLAIATNQPAAAKGKTTLANLHAVHAAVVTLAQALGARIATSQLCLHRAEDGCDCRKPRPGLLLQALAAIPDADRHRSWMIGDGVTDVAAGKAAGVRTAFVGARKPDAERVFETGPGMPDHWATDLPAFVDWLAHG